MVTVGTEFMALTIIVMTITVIDAIEVHSGATLIVMGATMKMKRKIIAMLLVTEKRLLILGGKLTCEKAKKRINS